MSDMRPKIRRPKSERLRESLQRRLTGHVCNTVGPCFWITPDGEPAVELFAHANYTSTKTVPDKGKLVEFDLLPVDDEFMCDRAINVEVV